MTPMKKTEYRSIGETLYSGELENGLKIFVIPKKGFNSFYAVFGTHYGGSMRRFEINGETIDTPAGVAHFLEHKMFDMPDGSNALNSLSESGADANAFTSTDMTCYHFSCTERFEENLRKLLTFVSTPYYTEETVQKEQGIIGQEIQMGDDSPGRQIYYDLLSLLYEHHPIRDAVVGTKESIAEITAKTLYDCHSVFYAPSNMVLCVEGDVEPERIAAIAEEILPKDKKSIPHADFGESEALVPAEKRKEREMPVAMPEFLIGAYRFRQELRSEAAFRDMKAAGVDFVIDEFHRDKPSLDQMRRLGLRAISSHVVPGAWGGHTNVNGKLATLLPLSKFEEVARRLTRHPAEMMFSAGDENSALDFPHLGRAFRRVKELNPA